MTKIGKIHIIISDFEKGVYEMELTKEDYQNLIKQKKILPYEPQLLENLRKKEAYGIPILILILSHPCCAENCYPMSVLISTGMDHFTLVHGNVNCIPKNDQYPNHSWVEKDGFVYDTTDGFKWEKNLYYQLFSPEVINTYREDDVKTYSFYQDVLRNVKNPILKQEKGLILQYLALLEEENPTPNHTNLLFEIGRYQEQEHLPVYSEKTMRQYQKILEKEKL